MSAKNAWLAVLVLAGWTTPAPAQVNLAWKFKEGEILYTENVEALKQTLDYSGKTVKQESTTTTISKLVIKQNTDRGTIIDITIESVKTKANPPESFQDSRTADKMKGATFTVTLSPAGKITKLAGYDEFVKRLADGNEDVEKLVRMRLSEEGIRKSIEDTFGFLPGRAVAKGEAWKQDASVALGPFGSFKVVKSYSYQGKENEGDAIAFTSAMTYVPPPAEGALVKVIKGSLKADEGKGSFLFDSDNGRLVRGSNHVLIRGALTVEFMNEQQAMDVVVDLTTTVRILSKNPLAK